MADNEIRNGELDNCEKNADVAPENIHPLETEEALTAEKEEVLGELSEKELLIEILAQMRELNQAINNLSQQAQQYYKNPVAHNLKDEANAEVEKDADFVVESEQQAKNSKSKKKKVALAGEIFFYTVLIGLILVAFLIRSGSSGRPISIAGYSAFTVLTSSMESEIPKGSLVITKSVKPDELVIGDDITYMSGPTSTITHRIIGITEKYLDTNERAFETKGIMNAEPDKKPVPAVNVVGKVVFHSEAFGKVAKFASDNWPFLLFVLIIVIALFTILKKVFKEDGSDRK